jgi:hypothetical protein
MDEELCVFSHTIDWMNTFTPAYAKARKTSHTPHYLPIVKLCRWSNKKAALLGMGTKLLYETFVPFLQRGSSSTCPLNT